MRHYTAKGIVTALGIFAAAMGGIGLISHHANVKKAERLEATLKRSGSFDRHDENLLDAMQAYKRATTAYNLRHFRTVDDCRLFKKGPYQDECFEHVERLQNILNRGKAN